MNDQLMIENDGGKIVATNYFDLPHAAAGKVYLSTNERTFRLLVPTRIDAPEKTLGGLLQELRKTKYVIVTRGQLPEGGEGMELLFEDHSDSPYVITLGATSCDRFPLPEDAGRTDLRFAIWTSGPQLMQSWAARYRQQPKLPCGKPWPTKR